MANNDRRQNRVLRGWFKWVAIALLLIAIQGWCFYRPFINGWLPGVYPFAVLYSNLAWFPAALAFLAWISIFIVPWPVVLFVVVAICLYSAFALSRRHRLPWRRARRPLLVVLLIALIGVPAFQTLSPQELTTIDAWNRAYQTAYHYPFLEENYGDYLVFECDRTGWFCHRGHFLATSYVTTAEPVSIEYSAESDRLTIKDQYYIRYLRTKDNVICPSPTENNKEVAGGLCANVR